MSREKTKHSLEGDYCVPARMRTDFVEGLAEKIDDERWRTAIPLWGEHTKAYQHWTRKLEAALEKLDKAKDEGRPLPELFEIYAREILPAMKKIQESARHTPCGYRYCPKWITDPHRTVYCSNECYKKEKSLRQEDKRKKQRR